MGSIMTRPFKVSPKTSLRGTALATEVRQTYPLSKTDERALRVAVKNLLVKRLSRSAAAGTFVRDFNVGRAANVLGVKTADLRQELAGHGFGTARPVNHSRSLSKMRAAPKTKRASSRRGQTRRSSRSLARGRG